MARGDLLTPGLEVTPSTGNSSQVALGSSPARGGFCGARKYLAAKPMSIDSSDGWNLAKRISSPSNGPRICSLDLADTSVSEDRWH